MVFRGVERLAWLVVLAVPPRPVEVVVETVVEPVRVVRAFCEGDVNFLDRSRSAKRRIRIHDDARPHCTVRLGHFHRHDCAGARRAVNRHRGHRHRQGVVAPRIGPEKRLCRGYLLPRGVIGGEARHAIRVERDVLCVHKPPREDAGALGQYGRSREKERWSDCQKRSDKMWLVHVVILSLS